MDRRPDTMLSSAGRGGWHHAVSTDQVHWQDRGINPIERQENYQGMNSLESPCSGFVTVDDDGIPCSGFRQCGSSHGTTELNPKAHAWDVPLEVRCAENDNMCDTPPTLVGALASVLIVSAAQPQDQVERARVPLPVLLQPRAAVRSHPSVGGPRWQLVCHDIDRRLQQHPRRGYHAGLRRGRRP